jgi:hypothetical protein
MILLNNLRLRHGLRWTGKLPSLRDIREFLKGCAIALACFGILGTVQAFDDLAERVIVMERAADIYEAEASVLAACERGAIGYHRASGKVFECSKPL